jgi:hypothetical protein
LELPDDARKNADFQDSAESIAVSIKMPAR